MNSSAVTCGGTQERKWQKSEIMAPPMTPGAEDLALSYRGKTNQEGFRLPSTFTACLNSARFQMNK